MRKTGLFILKMADPCTEDWSRMSSVDGRRYCDSCNKAVLDLRGKSNEEILRLVSMSPHHVCGRIERFRANTPLSTPQPPKPWPTAAAVLTGLTLACATPAPAEEMPEVPTQGAPQAPSAEPQSEESRPEVTDTPGPSVIYGRVTSPEGEALPGIEVLVEGTDLRTTTDIEGRYRLHIEPLWRTMQQATLQIHFDEVVSAELLVDRSSAEQKTVQLEFKFEELGGIIIVERVPLYKRLWWRLRGALTGHAQ